MKVAAQRKKITDVNQLWRNGSQPATTAVSTWTSSSQEPIEAPQGWEVPSETLAKTKKANPDSASAPEPTLIPAEQFGYSSEYKSPASLMVNSSGTINSNNPSGSAVASPAKPQDQGPSTPHAVYGSNPEWATWSTCAVPKSMDAFCAIVAPTSRVSTPATPSTGTSTTGLEQALQHTTLLDRQDQRASPRPKAQDATVATTWADPKWA